MYALEPLRAHAVVSRQPLSEEAYRMKLESQTPAHPLKAWQPKTRPIGTPPRQDYETGAGARAELGVDKRSSCYLSCWHAHGRGWVPQRDRSEGPKVQNPACRSSQQVTRSAY